MRRIGRRKWVYLALLGLFLVYCLSFAEWWLTSPSFDYIRNGKQVHRVELHMTPFRWKTGGLWIFGIWYVEKVLGYAQVNALLMFENSVYFYEKETGTAE